MKKQWNLPKINNLEVNKTQDDSIQPFYWNPKYSECSDPTNTGEGYEMCNKWSRPCKYFGVLAGGGAGECNAPSAKQEQPNS